MEYEADRAQDAGGEPSLTKMTEIAINRLDQSEDGYVLMVESARVDHTHREGNAARALEDMVAFDAAIKRALEMTDRGGTLIVVTADHSHAMTINGYHKRDNPTPGLVIDVENELTLGLDGKPYTTRSYAKGPGGVFPALPEPAVEDVVAEADAALPEAGGAPAVSTAAPEGEAAAPLAMGAASTEITNRRRPPRLRRDPKRPRGWAPQRAPRPQRREAAHPEAEAVVRPNLTNVNTEHVDFLQQGLVPLASETHGGDDVAVFAWDPSAHAFHGVIKQNLIYHVMAHAIGHPREFESSGEAAPAD